MILLIFKRNLFGVPLWLSYIGLLCIACTGGDEIQPTFFRFRNNMVSLDEPANFDLEVRIEKSDPDLQAAFSFQSKLYLSSDELLGADDAELEYGYFDFGKPKVQRDRSFPAGNHTLYLGGNPLTIPASAITTPSLCGEIFVIYKADSGDEIIEVEENNNALSTPIIISCNQSNTRLAVNDILHLRDFQFQIEEFLRAERDSVISLDYDVINTGGDLPLPSPRSPLYDVILSNNDTGIRLIPANMIQYPDDFYRPMLKGSRHTFRGLMAISPGSVLTESECENTNSLQLCITRTGDTVPNHCLVRTLDNTKKRCQPPTYDHDIDVLDFYAPTYFDPTTITVHMAYTVELGAAAASLASGDFKSALYLTHRPDVPVQMDPADLNPVLDGHHLADLNNIISIAAGEKKWNKETFSSVSLNALPDNSYCGRQSLHLVVDSGREVNETSEMNNRLTKSVTILCPGDVWTPGSITFSSPEGMLVENVSVPFTLQLPISCVDPTCNIPVATENIVLEVLFGTTNTLIPPTSAFTIDQDYNGFVEPGLGLSFPAPSIVRMVEIRGSMALIDNICDDGVVAIVVRVDSGPDAPAMIETVAENNAAKIFYPCSQGLKGDSTLRDLVAYPIEILGGSQYEMHTGGAPEESTFIMTGMRNIFRLRFEANGPQIPPQDGCPPSAPFSYGLYISPNPELDANDMRIPYLMSDGIASIINNLPDVEAHTVDAEDFYGFATPAGLCGWNYIIIHLDDTARITEASEANNMAATRVFVICPDDVFALSGLEMDRTAPFWPDRSYEITLKVDVTNVAEFEITAGIAPFGLLEVYLSEDAILDVPLEAGDQADIVVQIDSLTDEMKERMRGNIYPGSSTTIQLTISDLTITNTDCSQLQYIIVNLQPLRNFISVDQDTSNNYVALAIRTECNVGLDIYATGFSPSGELIAGANWTTVESRPDSYTYRIVASHDEVFDPELDPRIGVDGRHTVSAFAGQNDTVLASIDLNRLPNTHCGHVFLIAELDVDNKNMEENEDNNLIVTPVVKTCGTDHMSFNVGNITSEGLFCGEDFQLSMEFTVNCYTDDNSICTDQEQTSDNNFHFNLKFLDANFVNISTPVPSVLDDTTISNPEVLRQTLHLNPLAFAINMNFTLASRVQCEDIAYLEVELLTGTSTEMSSVNIGPAESKLRRIPLTFLGEPSRIDVYPTFFTAGNVNMSDQSTFELSLYVQVDAENWKYERTHSEAFSYTLGVKSDSDPDWNIENLGYVFGPSIMNLLSTQPSTGLLDLSERTEEINWDILRRFCGHDNIRLSVKVDSDSRLAEEDETNNELISNQTFLITGCQNGLDLKITNFEISDNDLTSGDVVNVDLDVEIVITGPNEGLPQKTWPDRNYDIRFDLLSSVHEPRLVHPVEYDPSGLPELSARAMTIHTEDENDGLSHIVKHQLNGMNPLNIPPDTAICDKAWFLRVGVHLQDQGSDAEGEDLAPDDNFAFVHIYIKCKDDRLSLLDLNKIIIPEEIWSDAEHDYQFGITVINMGPAIPAPDSYLFSVNVHFSPQSTWDPSLISVGSAAVVQSTGDTYEHNAGMADQGILESPVLKVTLNIPKDACEEAIGVLGKPTLFIQMSRGPGDHNYSPFEKNDVLKYSLNKSRIFLKAASVDLKVTALSVAQGTGNIKSNTETQFQFTIKQTKTPAGSIPPSEGDELSYNFTLFLSSDEVFDGTDRMVPINYTKEQEIHMQRGIVSTTADIIVFAGRNLFVDLDKQPLFAHYCGTSYLIVHVMDLKNSENIDPVLSNNYLGVPIKFQCGDEDLWLEGATTRQRRSVGLTRTSLDVLELEEISLTLMSGKREFFPGINTTLMMRAQVNYHSKIEQPSATLMKPLVLFRLFLSIDALLDVYHDPEFTVEAVVPNRHQGFTPGMNPAIYEGYLNVNIHECSCRFSPRYILAAVMLGGQQTQQEVIILNNYKVIPLNGLFNCSIHTVDLSILRLTLSMGQMLTPGSHSTYTLEIMANFTGEAFLGSMEPDDEEGQLPRMFEYAFYLSLNEELDEGDAKLPHDYPELDDLLRVTMRDNGVISLSPTNDTLDIPEDLDPRLCGKAFLLIVVDPRDEIRERDETNNVAYVVISIACPDDVLAIDDINVNLQPKYYPHPGGIDISMTLTAYGGAQFTYIGDAMMITICVKRATANICHDITPRNQWKLLRDMSNVTFSNKLPVGQSNSYASLLSYIDITEACNADKEPIISGENEIIIKIVVGGRVAQPGYFDGVPSNNVYKTSFNADCREYYLDISVAKFNPTTVSGEPIHMVQLGMNYFELKCNVNTSSRIVYNSLIGRGQVFDYKFFLVAQLERLLDFEPDGTPVIQPDHRTIQLDYQTLKRPINRQINDHDTLILTDRTRGIRLPKEQFYWMCLAKDLKLNVTLDCTDNLKETDEYNNMASLTNLTLPECEDGQDLVVKTWSFPGLRHDELSAEKDCPYLLRVETLLVGDGARAINGIPAANMRQHFQVWYFISLDDERTLGDDDVVIGLNLTAFQIAALKKYYLDLDLIVLDGVMNIPINATTYKYCWRKVYIGVLINPDSVFEEITHINNIAFDEVIFDCGNALDECERDLDNCHDNATCIDRPFSLFDYRQGPLNSDSVKSRFECVCNKGFKGDGISSCTNINECTEMDDNGMPYHHCGDIPNSKCVDEEGSYTCKCDAGFRKNTLFATGITMCEDINECTEGGATDCHPDADCTNKDGSYACYCKPGFTGDGVHCEDIDECDSVQCQNGGVCHNERNYFRCECPDFHEGKYCEIVNGNWGRWGPWSPCNPSCGVMSRSYRIRVCDSPSPKNGGQTCGWETGYGNKETKVCNVPACEKQEIGTCAQSQCKKTGGCDALYQDLVCDRGNEKRQNDDGTIICADIDECNTTDGLIRHNCDRQLGVCKNYANSFHCSCPKGYIMKPETGTQCHDKKECTDGTHQCNESAICVEVGGGYECHCKPGYKREKYGDPLTGTCVEERLLPYGAENGDTLVTNVSSISPGERVSGLICFPHGLPLFDRTLAECCYISEDGSVIVTSEVLDESSKDPYQHAQMFSTFDVKDEKVAAIIAPFMTDTNHSKSSRVWYHVYTYSEDQAIFSDIKKLSMKAEGSCPIGNIDYALQVTWHELKPAYQCTDEEIVTFQTIIYTDSKHTCVIFVYDKHGMNWTPHEGNWPDVEAGYWTAAKNYSILHSELEGPTFDEIFQIGIMQFRLDDNTADYYNPRRECIDWYARQPERLEKWQAELAKSCPRYLNQARRDYRLKEDLTAEHVCFTRIWSLTNGANVRCCYKSDSGAFSQTKHFSPRADFYHIHGFVILSSNDSDACRWCCKEGPDGKFDYCGKFLEKRLPSSTEEYDELVPAMIDGGGFYTTFDGGTKILTTFGEYLASRSSCLTLQTRHSKDQSDQDSVHVRGIGIRVSCVSDAKVAIYSNGTAVEVWIDGVLWTQNMVLDGFVILDKDDCGDKGIFIIFKNGIVLQVTNRDMRLRALIMVPRSIMESDMFEGLLGDGDGDPDNDDRPFTPQNDGQGYMATSDTDIQSWELIQVCGRSESGNNAGDCTLFNHYTPAYITADEDVVINSALDYYKRSQSIPSLYVGDESPNRPLCTYHVVTDPYLACLVDVLLTGNQTRGKHTLDNYRCYLDLRSSLSHTPPHFKNAPTQYVITPMEDTYIEYTVVAWSPMNLPLTFTPSLRRKGHLEILGTAEKEHTMTVSKISASEEIYEATFTYTMGGTHEPLFLSILASDGQAKSIWQPQILLCPCQNGGECKIGFAEIQDDLGMWKKCRCICPFGRSGSDCSEDRDGCKINPCQTECTDFHIYEQEHYNAEGFMCAPCENGLDGTGRTCYDQNECLLEETHPKYHQCDHICIDTNSGYECQCRRGFISVDQWKCKDIEECATPDLNNCDSVYGTCVDEPAGSYTCGCLPGYTLLPNNTCVDIDECIKKDTCPQICKNTPGSFQCSCRFGFEKTFQDKCEDVDECALGIDSCDTGCKNTNGTYECYCTQDGFSLDEDKCRCKPYPDRTCPERYNNCLHPEAFCSIIDGVTSCHCPKGFFQGTDIISCIDLDECSTNLHTCDSLSDCHNLNGTFECRCKKGLVKDSATSKCIDYDECSVDHNCEHKCVNIYGSFMCSCNEGYNLDADGISCVDTNECEVGQVNDCAPEANCRKVNEGYTCICEAGYVGDGINCEDEDSCEMNNGGCTKDCKDVLGGRVCGCPPGSIMDESDYRRCQDINECAIPESAAKCSHNCHNVNTLHPSGDGYYRCSCRYGYTLMADGRSCAATQNDCDKDCGGGMCVEKLGQKACECFNGYEQKESKPGVLPALLTSCTNIDECESDAHLCKTATATNTTGKITCLDLTPGYECACTNGYTQTLDRTSCIDKDECKLGSHTCDLSRSSCENTVGSYNCRCKDGFQHHPSYPLKCIDIDECSKKTLQINPCDDCTKALCINVPGSYTCKCRAGFWGNGTHCYDLNECKDMRRCDPQKEKCVNENGGYRCECKDGYQRHINGECRNINECLSPTLNKCQKKSRCKDKPGSYMCVCCEDEIPNNEGLACTARRSCTETEMRSCGNANCKIKDISAEGEAPLYVAMCVCEYPFEYQDGVGCVDVDECKQNPCMGHGKCINQKPLFTCQCEEPYLLSEDGLQCIETNGRYGPYKKATDCSYDCGGVTTSIRLCNKPAPVGVGRKCEGKAEKRELCTRVDISKCQAKVPQLCVFVDIEEMEPEDFEKYEGKIMEAELDTLNDYFKAKGITEGDVCPQNTVFSKDRILVLTSKDLQASGNYPKGMQSKTTRFLRCIVLNRICKPLEQQAYDVVVDNVVHAMNYESGNDKVRNILQYSNETIFLPNRIYINAMEEKSTKNDTLFMKNLNEILNDCQNNDVSGPFVASFVPAYAEEELTTTQVTVTEAPDVLPPWGIALIVCVAAFIIIILITVIVIKAKGKGKEGFGSGRISPADSEGTTQASK